MLIRRKKLVRRSKKLLLRRGKPLLTRRKEPTNTVPRELYCDAPWYWRYIAGDSDTCYVCDKRFKRDARRVYIGLHPFNSAKIYRHFSSCSPLTSKWAKKFGGREYFNTRVAKWRVRKNSRAIDYTTTTSSFLPDTGEDVAIIKRDDIKTKLKRRK